MSNGSPEPIDREALIARLAALEPEAVGDGSAVRVVRAPGRVNLIGEHTDYNSGFVLPVAIDREVRIAFVPTADRRVRLHPQVGDPAEVDLDELGARRGTWIDYVAGTAWALAGDGLGTVGLRGVVASTLPQEAGLSSSAALELAAAWALSGSTAPRRGPLDLAVLCQRAENDYVGVRCGLMDQFAVACGVTGSALLLDCRSLEHRPVALPRDRLALVVCHTGSSRRLGASAYNTRRRECEGAVAAVAAQRPGITSLRDLGVEDVPWLATVLDEVALRRARHVITENARVLATVAALEGDDDGDLGPLFAASHASLRDDYEVGSPELDALVEIARGTPGVVAARMTGAGFGGCTVNLVRPDSIDRLRDAVERDYPRRTGLRPLVMPVTAAAGAGVV
jgi:galactokinase